MNEPRNALSFNQHFNLLRLFFRRPLFYISTIHIYGRTDKKRNTERSVLFFSSGSLLSSCGMHPALPFFPPGFFWLDNFDSNLLEIDKVEFKVDRNDCKCCWIVNGVHRMSLRDELVGVLVVNTCTQSTACNKNQTERFKYKTTTGQREQILQSRQLASDVYWPLGGGIEAFYSGLG